MDLLLQLIEGGAEGRAEGRVDLVLQVLGLRFGPLPADVAAQVRLAPEIQLDSVVERLLVAPTLEEVLCPLAHPTGGSTNDNAS